MDPLTGIGLAASVITLVSFSFDAVKKCREVYQRGSLAEYDKLDDTTDHLAKLTSSLQLSLQNPAMESLALSREERDLVILSQKSADCASTLQQELHKLQIQPHGSALNAARKAARAIWKKDSIHAIEKQLESYKSTLEASLLHRLSQRFDAQGLHNDKSFGSLDDTLQHIVACLANSQTSLTALVAQESEQTRQYITAHIDRIERHRVEDDRYKQVIGSLFYPDISSRQEQIANEFDGIEDSYHWVFYEPRTHRTANSDQEALLPLWDNFAHWLTSGYGVYWINGKAGSGKSTLMHHICKDKRRLELLAEWCSDRKLLTPTFFFWNAGTRQQKTIDGLLRSLIYQLLTECRELIACFKPEPLHTWTESRLLSTLVDVLRQTHVPLAICMFVDGLDEFDGRYDRVITMLNDLADQKHVKICLSSRPLLPFEKAFEGKPSLKLQDLTFDSILAYAHLQLSDLIRQHVSYDKGNKHRAPDLLNKIVHRADGVFLWAVIAIREVRDGLQEEVDVDELAQAIASLPSQLESLYMTMLSHIKPACQRNAAKILQLILHGQHMDLCMLHLCQSQQELEDAPFRYEKVSISTLVEACHTLRTRLLSHTGGLLELTPQNHHTWIYGNTQDYNLSISTRVDFIHRTARDFLLKNDEAKYFLAEHGSTEAQVHLSIARGRLALLTQFAQEDAEPVDREVLHPVYFPFYEALEEVSIAERLSSAAQSNLMQSLNYESFVQGYPVTEIANSTGMRYVVKGSFIIVAGLNVVIDVVGMAATVGMTRYICEKLDLPVDSWNCTPRFPDLKHYSRHKSNTAIFYWNRPRQLQDLDISVASSLRSSNYRQALFECLCWKVETQSQMGTDAHSEGDSLPESYMLACCRPFNVDLVRILLQAGANPMVRIKPCNSGSIPARVQFRSKHFWHEWLNFLQGLHCDYMKVNGRSGSILFHDWERTKNRHLTLDAVFDTTKALLANGANINYKVDIDFAFPMFDYKRRPFYSTTIRIELTASAMFILKECFIREPEFCEFVEAVKPLIKTSIRDIVSIRVKGDDVVVFPNAGEKGLLWPLIEEWERTGFRSDWDALELAGEKICEAYHPGFKREGR